MDDYLTIVSQLPLPTLAQTEAFAKYVTRAHSWYKRLPPFPPGRLFSFFLDPQAGREIVEQTGPGEFQGMVVSNIPKHPSTGPFTSSKTDDYRRDFGFWNYQTLSCEDRRKSPVRVFRAEAVNLDPERENWLEVGLPVELPPELLAQCSCRLTALITGGVTQRTSLSALRESFADLELYLQSIPDSPHLARCRQVRSDLDNMKIFLQRSYSGCEICLEQKTWQITPPSGGQPYEFELPGFAEEQHTQQQELLRETLLRALEVFSKLCHPAPQPDVSETLSQATVTSHPTDDDSVGAGNSARLAAEDFVALCLKLAGYDLCCSLAELVRRSPNQRFAAMIAHFPDTGETGLRHPALDKTQLHAKSLGEVARQMLDFDVAEMGDADMGWLKTGEAGSPKRLLLRVFLGPTKHLDAAQLRELVEDFDAYQPDDRPLPQGLSYRLDDPGAGVDARRVDKSKWKACEKCGQLTPVILDRLPTKDHQMVETGTWTYVCANCGHCHVGTPRWDEDSRAQEGCYNCPTPFGVEYQCPSCCYPRGWLRVNCPYCGNLQPVYAPHWVAGCDFYELQCVECERIFYSLCIC